MIANYYSLHIIVITVSEIEKNEFHRDIAPLTHMLDDTAFDGRRCKTARY